MTWRQCARSASSPWQFFSWVKKTGDQGGACTVLKSVDGSVSDQDLEDCLKEGTFSCADGTLRMHEHRGSPGYKTSRCGPLHGLPADEISLGSSVVSHLGIGYVRALVCS